MSQFLPFAVPYIGEEEIEAVTDCLRSGWLTTGARAREFEAQFAEYVGSRHAVALNSCTAALHLALEAVGIQTDDEVLVPTLTFAATAEVVRYLNAHPVLMDCDPNTFLIDLEHVETYLKQQCGTDERGTYNRQTGARVKAILPVHYGGLPCDMERIGVIARRHNLTIIEDAAHALPCRTQGRMVGTFGTFGAFSFYANKTITTGEGGMLVTDDADLAQRARIMSLHGMNKDAYLRFTAEGSWYYEIIAPGFKYNITDIAAALGIVQLRRAEALWQIRLDYALRYQEAFAEVPEIQTPPDARAGDTHSWHLYVIQLELERLTLDRAQFIDKLKAQGIGTSVHYLPLHQHPYYRETYGYAPDDLPQAAGLYPRLITLPLYPKMTRDDVERVIEAVTTIVAVHRK
jgi:dTDP-4-amino-4,6-dideoxygalactose transaminase